MNILKEIQKSILNENDNIGPILLKLRYLASKLGSLSLEDWVKKESEGYSEAVDIPDYRMVDLIYLGHFSGYFGAEVKNYPIPKHLIKQIVGSNFFERHAVRNSISNIEDMINNNPNGIRLSFSNLPLILGDRVLENYNCNSVIGVLSKSSLVEIRNIVRSRILEFTIKLENQIPESKVISVDIDEFNTSRNISEKITKITHQTFYGDLNSISISGSENKAVINKITNSYDLIKFLNDAGISNEDAVEFIDILSSERPDPKSGNPFGESAVSWIKKNIGKAIDGTWKVGLDVATSLLTEAAKKYYGFN